MFFPPPEYLELFYGKYGSFIPLNEEDILQYLNEHLNADFNDRYVLLYSQSKVVKCWFSHDAVYILIQKENDQQRSAEVQGRLGVRVDAFL